MALDLDQSGELLGGLDALAGASDAEGICQRHDRVDDRAAFVVAVEGRSTKLRSILRMSSGSWLRLLSDE
jgi:hypothetical protein